MKSFLRAVKDVALLLSRLIMGGLLLAHGWHRWQVAGVDAEVAIIEAANLPQATTLAWLVIGFEILGGIVLIFGLATPLVGLGIVALNAGTIALVKPDELFMHQGGWEFNAVQGVVGLLLLAHGSGRAGLDSLFLRPKDDGGELIVDEADADRIHRQDF